MEETANRVVKKGHGMTPEHATSLYVKYPEIFRGRHRNRAERRFFGFECGDGWYALIDSLCAEIMSTGVFPVPEALQVKEKFGTLRFYVSDAPDEVLCLIEAASMKSREICEQCGEPGKLGSRAGWWGVLCKRHSVKRATMSGATNDE